MSTAVLGAGQGWGQWGEEPGWGAGGVNHAKSWVARGSLPSLAHRQQPPFYQRHLGALGAVMSPCGVARCGAPCPGLSPAVPQTPPAGARSVLCHEAEPWLRGQACPSSHPLLPQHLPNPRGGSSCWDPPKDGLWGAPTEVLLACPLCARLLALVPARTRVCVSPACPPGCHCLTRPPRRSCRGRWLFPLPNLARAGGAGGGRGCSGGSPRFALPEMTSKRGAGCPVRHKSPQEPELLPLPPGFLRSSAAPGGSGSGQALPPPQPHTGPPGCSPWEEPLISRAVCEVLSAPWSSALFSVPKPGAWGQGWDMAEGTWQRGRGQPILPPP